jgi:hypothetical protein
MCRDLDWERIRAEYETGSTQSELSRKYEVSRTAIQKRIAKESWVQGDVRETVERLAEARVAGVVAGCNPQKKAEALSAAADKIVAVMQGQRERVAKLVQKWNDAVAAGSFEDAKLVKISAESLKLINEEERKAYGITDKEGQDKKDKVYKVVLADEEQEF